MNDPSSFLHQKHDGKETGNTLAASIEKMHNPGDESDMLVAY